MMERGVSCLFSSRIGREDGVGFTWKRLEERLEENRKYFPCRMEENRKALGGDTGQADRK